MVRTSRQRHFIRDTFLQGFKLVLFISTHRQFPIYQEPLDVQQPRTNIQESGSIFMIGSCLPCCMPCHMHCRYILYTVQS